MKYLILLVLLVLFIFISCSNSETQLPLEDEKDLLITPTFVENSNLDSSNKFCELSDGQIVSEGWSGNDTGNNFCNKCRCMNGNLACTEMACITLDPNQTYAKEQTAVEEPKAETAAEEPKVETATKTPETEKISDTINSTVFSGTLFANSNILNSSDYSFFNTLEKIPDEERIMFDRRVDGWIETIPFLYNAKFSDEMEIEVQINKEFENLNIAEEIGIKYLQVIGKLPRLFRKDVETIWIHKGNEDFGGGNNNLLIHHGRGQEYEKDNFLEEVFLHESSHTSLDSYHRSAEEWIRAVKADNGNFISEYARDNPKREDIAETFPICFAIKYKSDRLRDEIVEKIYKTIPNRISYCNKVFDSFESKNRQDD